MKKVLSLLAGALVGYTAMAQNAFFEYTSYVGAFAPAPAARWTDGWCNFDPQNASYPTTNVPVTGDITTNTTWSNSNTYLLNDVFCYVRSGATLTIEPGTVIRGTGKGTLIVERGAKIIAQGTANQPIVFTSAANVGQRDYGDWGGIVICGAGVHNIAAGVNAEAEGGIGDDVSGRGLHGGTNDDDSSGVFSYCRIEFCGISLTPNSNSEVNGLSMYSVGRKTKIDHVQVSYSGDDSFEWFGGAVDCKYLVAFRGWDDDFDTDNGFKGRVQFGFSIRDSRIADQSGSNGFESDNDANGSTRAPKTHPVFSNMTVIGPNWTGNADSTNSLHGRSLHVRRNSGISVYNSIFTGHKVAGFLLDGRKTAANYCTDTIGFCGNLLVQEPVGKYYALANNTDTLCVLSATVLATLAQADGNDTLTTTTALMLANAFGNTNSNPDLRPNTGSPALTNGSCWAWNSTFLGIEDNNNAPAADDLTIYPNPASDIVTVSLNANAKADAKITLVDLTGKVVAILPVNQISNGANVFTFDVSNLSSGIYMLNIQSAAFSKVEKLIVR